MKKVRVAGAALNQTPLDWELNFEQIRLAITEAKQQQVDILCLPELCISGYGCEDAFFAAGTCENSLETLRKILPETSGIAVAVGLPLLHQKHLYNCCCFIVNGKISGFVAKQNLCIDGIHYESRWFKAWPKGKVSEVVIDGMAIAFGDLIFAIDGINIGFEICEDAWVTDRPAYRLANSGVDLILNLSASHFCFGKIELRKALVKESSRFFNCGYVYANLNGNEAGRAIYDGGTLIANCGQILAQGQRLSFRDVVLTVADLDLQTGQTPSNPKLKINPSELVFSIKSEYHFYSAQKPAINAQALSAEWEQSSSIKFEEFARAVSLGLFDYCRKSKSNGFVLSLSGGADSATIACLVKFSFVWALSELGIEALKAKLPFLKEVKDIQEILKKSLLTVYQSSANSGEITRTAAAAVAAAVGAEHHQISVATIIAEYVSTIEASLGKKLTWEKDDITLQNIQARARGPSAWIFANIRNALLLATSNRSEVAVGYATMDGDTCGSISPIAGVDKAFIRKWLLWLEQEGPLGIGSISALSAINSQQPTAELRPGGGQTDEADLMPYDVLEVIERAAIRDKMDPQQILQLVKTKFPNAQKAEHLHWVKLFFTLWSRSQWKRERYAPSFHLDDQSLDPKTWCRYPILSGAFRKELEELK
jgi:NAD+ synthase (glutamine-hydrolysing)